MFGGGCRWGVSVCGERPTESEGVGPKRLKRVEKGWKGLERAGGDWLSALLWNCRIAELQKASTRMDWMDYRQICHPNNNNATQMPATHTHRSTHSDTFISHLSLFSFSSKSYMHAWH